jgi:Tfp pilus assembly protein PilP
MHTVFLCTVLVALTAPAVRADTLSPIVASGETQAAPPPAPAPATPQPPAAAPATPQPQPQPQGSAASQPPPPESYTYHADGRRDPFQNLLGTGSEKNVTSGKGEGPAGMTLGEVSIRGIMQSRGSLVAMIMGPDKKTYIVHQGDKLLDGTIKTITPQGLIVIQEVNDPLSLVKQREVRKLLRSLEDAKE